MGDLIAFVVIVGGLIWLVWTAFIGQYRPHRDGFTCRDCGEWQTTLYGCPRCGRLNHPASRGRQ